MKIKLKPILLGTIVSSGVFAMMPSFLGKDIALAQSNCSDGFECFELALKELEQAKKEIQALEKRLEDLVKETESKASAAQATANTAVSKADTAQSTVDVFANSEVLNKFIQHARYRQSSGGHWFALPNVEAWDLKANGQFYSGHGFVSTQNGQIRHAKLE